MTSDLVGENATNLMSVEGSFETASESGLDVMDDKQSNKTQDADELKGTNIAKLLESLTIYSTPHQSTQLQTTSEQPESETSKQEVEN